MRISPRVRLELDLCMAALMLSALAFRITGGLAHEWIGLAAALLFAFHSAVNYRWYALLFSGKYAARRFVNAALNAALLACALAMFATGFMLSKHVLAFLELSGNMELRQIHATSAYWLLILASAHLGMHWNMILGFAGLNKNAAGASRARGAALWILGLAAATCGVWAFVERDMFSKLFLGYSFDFWDPDSPAALFFLANAAIMALCVLVVHCAMQIAVRIGRRKSGGD